MALTTANTREREREREKRLRIEERERETSEIWHPLTWIKERRRRAAQSHATARGSSWPTRVASSRRPLSGIDSEIGDKSDSVSAFRVSRPLCARNSMGQSVSFPFSLLFSSFFLSLPPPLHPLFLWNSSLPRSFPSSPLVLIAKWSCECGWRFFELVGRRGSFSVRFQRGALVFGTFC